MASILFEKKNQPLFEETHRALRAWREQHPEHESIHMTDVLRDPRDGSLSFLVWFPDAKEEALRPEIDAVVRLQAAEVVNARWHEAQGRLQYT